MKFPPQQQTAFRVDLHLHHLGYPWQLPTCPLANIDLHFFLCVCAHAGAGSWGFSPGELSSRASMACTSLHHAISTGLDGSSAACPSTSAALSQPEGKEREIIHWQVISRDPLALFFKIPISHNVPEWTIKTHDKVEVCSLVMHLGSICAISHCYLCQLTVPHWQHILASARKFLQSYFPSSSSIKQPHPTLFQGATTLQDRLEVARRPGLLEKGKTFLESIRQRY